MFALAFLVEKAGNHLNLTAILAHKSRWQVTKGMTIRSLWIKCWSIASLIVSPFWLTAKRLTI